MPAFIGKNPRAWRENIAGDSGGIKLAGDDGGKYWREGVAGRVVTKAGGKHGGVNAKRREKILQKTTRVQQPRLIKIGFSSPIY